jgi:hypothetical protein
MTSGICGGGRWWWCWRGGLPCRDRFFHRLDKVMPLGKGGSTINKGTRWPYHSTVPYPVEQNPPAIAFERHPVEWESRGLGRPNEGRPGVFGLGTKEFKGGLLLGRHASVDLLDKQPGLQLCVPDAFKHRHPPTVR